MSSSSDVQSQLTSIMEVFAKSALAEMCKVVENDSAVLRLAISRQEREIGLLWRRLQLAENEAKAARRAEALRAATSSRHVYFTLSDLCKYGTIVILLKHSIDCVANDLFDMFSSFNLGTVADVDDALAAFTQSILPNLTSQQSLINALKGLGVETLDDLKYVQDTDLSDVLRPIEARKLISRLKGIHFFVNYCLYHIHDCNVDQSLKIPHSVRTKFEKQERPSGRERREIVRLIVDEVLTVCQNPRKKHLAEIARKMALKYPKSFKDISGHQTTGSGYDSLTKQLQCRVDNLKRENVRFQLKRRHTKTLKTETQDVRSKKTRLDSYGCINWQPSCLPLQETTKTQKEKQEELLNLHRDGVKDHNKIVKLMISTFRAQRKDIVTGTGTHELSKMWPYLFEMCGSKAHFHKLTGVSLNANFYAAMSSKCGRILNYFQSLPQGQNEKISKILINFDERSTEATILTCVQILLVYFSEDEEKLMVKVEDTCLPCEVTSEQLPTTPCIVLCGNELMYCFLCALVVSTFRSRMSYFCVPLILLSFVFLMGHTEVCSSAFLRSNARFSFLVQVYYFKIRSTFISPTSGKLLFKLTIDQKCLFSNKDLMLQGLLFQVFFIVATVSKKLVVTLSNHCNNTVATGVLLYKCSIPVAVLSVIMKVLFSMVPFLYTGSNALTADLYMVSVDKIIVNKALSSFGDALVLMFTCYYMLNINYPVEVCATLDFLQR
uniref:Uncharacterized protein n=1 Tax=Denticeps clupeoides TaxID=299321 RepID=A0AAY4BNW9_9TELE